MTGEDNMNELNQLMMAERSVFADMRGGGELAHDLGQIIERAQLKPSTNK